MTDIIRVDDLKRRFQEVQAVKGLTLNVESGETFGLLGPNGAGKTTVIRMLTTLLPPTSGTASIGGFDIVKQAPQVRRIIGYVPQMVSADGTLTGYENLLIFAKLYAVPAKEREKRIQNAIATMNLGDAANRLVSTYSGGMLRRIEIAQAMIHHPEVLFLDEPTVGLDPVARESVWEQIELLRSEFGVTILITTHYMEEADRFCDRIAIMNRGLVAAIGTPDELKGSIDNPDATLDDVFTYYAGNVLTESEGGFREAGRTRRAASRHG